MVKRTRLANSIDASVWIAGTTMVDKMGMDEGPLDLPEACDGTRSIDVLDLAVQAIAVLASSQSGAAAESVSQMIDELYDAIVHPDEYRRHAVVSRLVANGISAEEIVDRYAPIAAARLGSMWIQDKVTFAEVTIGAGRLQEMVRSLGKRAGSPNTTIPLGHSILLAVPPGENHMLGAFIAASQFRRYGMWVHMAIGQTPDELVATLQTQTFQMVGLSSAGRRAITGLRQIIDTLKANVDLLPPIVVGGQVEKLEVDLISATGADLITSNPREALEFCGLLRTADVLDAASLVK